MKQIKIDLNKLQEMFENNNGNDSFKIEDNSIVRTWHSGVREYEQERIEFEIIPEILDIEKDEKKDG